MKSVIAGVGVVAFGSAALLSPAHAATWAFKDQIAVPASPSNIIGGRLQPSTSAFSIP